MHACMYMQIFEKSAAITREHANVRSYGVALDQRAVQGARKLGLNTEKLERHRLPGMLTPSHQEAPD